MLLQLGAGHEQAPARRPAHRAGAAHRQAARRAHPQAISVSDDRRAADTRSGEIVKDLQSGQPMNRLLQGDVGSGKTVVALYAMLVAVANKMQAAHAGADRSAGRAAFPDAVATCCADRSVQHRAVHQPHEAQSRAARSRSSSPSGEDAPRRRHAGADPGGRRVREPRPGRRSTSSTSSACGSAALLKSNGPLAALPGDDRDADPAHAGAVVLRGFRSERDRRASARPSADPHAVAASPSKRRKAYDFIRKQVARGRQAYIVLPQIDDNGARRCEVRARRNSSG